MKQPLLSSQMIEAALAWFEEDQEGHSLKIEGSHRTASIWAYDCSLQTGAYIEEGQNIAQTLKEMRRAYLQDELAKLEA